MKKKLRKVANISPVQLLKAAMAQRRKCQGEVEELRRMLVEKTERRRDLETGGDLNDARVIGEIGKLQIGTATAPDYWVRLNTVREQDTTAGTGTGGIDGWATNVAAAPILLGTFLRPQRWQVKTEFILATPTDTSMPN